MHGARGQPRHFTGWNWTLQIRRIPRKRQVQSGCPRSACRDWKTSRYQGMIHGGWKRGDKGLDGSERGSNLHRKGRAMVYTRVLSLFLYYVISISPCSNLIKLALFATRL